MGRLFWKFFFAFWLALLLAGAGVGTAVWLHHQAQSHEPATHPLGLRHAGQSLVNAAAAVLRRGGVPALRGLLDAWAQERLPQVYAVDAQGRELLGRPVPPDAPDANGAAQAVEAGGQVYQLFVVAPQLGRPPLPPPGLGAGPPPGFAPGPPPPGPRGGPPPLYWLIIAGVLASLAFSAWLAWYLAQPVRHLRGAFAALAGGRLDTRVAGQMGRRRDEVADLGRDFDHMAEQVGNLIQAHRRLLHDVSHELRSPLARLQAAIGLARQQPAEAEKYLTRVEREAERLDGLVSELLTLSRLEAGLPVTTAEEFDLAELVTGIVEDARFEAQSRQIDVQWQAPPGFPFTGQVELIHRAIENIIRNAVQHSADGAVVEVALAQHPLTLVVQDRGHGVPAAELAAIFQPFFRSPSQPGKVGAGLGLAIAKLAVEAHGGSIQARNREGRGLRVEIGWPAAAEAARQANAV